MTSIEPYLIAHVPWLWLVGGIVLCTAETVAPGIFLLWIGLAAIATGLTQFFLPLNWEPAVVLFAFLAVALALLGRTIYGASEKRAAEPFLNRPTEALVGREFVLEKPISHGYGSKRVDDTIWRVRGTDQPSGVRVRVKRVEGDVLLVVETV
jgi:membrane protein implicated in regulation of membrane protease activity